MALDKVNLLSQSCINTELFMEHGTHFISDYRL